MGARFGDLAQFIDDSLTLPIGGKAYVIPGPSVDVGLMCQELFASGIGFAAGAEVSGEASALKRVVLEGDEETNFYVKIITKPVYDELVADGVTYTKIKHVGTTVFLWIAVNVEVAERFWTTGVLSMTPLEPTAPAANRETRRRSTSTQAAKDIPRQGSRSGTASPRTSKTNSPAKEPRSRGSKSSTVGR